MAAGAHPEDDGPQTDRSRYDERRLAEPTTFGARLLRAGRREFWFDPAPSIAHLVSRAFPQFRFNRTRTALLRATGISIGAGSAVMGTVYVSGSGPLGLLTVGENTSISGPLHVDLGARVHIGARVHLGHHVHLMTMDHELGPSEERCGGLIAAPIDIGDGAWLGSWVTVLPGVSIGTGAVVAAGALVTASVAPDTLVGGVPARVIRTLPRQGADGSGRRRGAPVQYE
jgi:maltose O-acetyltransferase